MNKITAQEAGAYIAGDAARISDDPGKLAEELLGHGIMGADVEHIDGTVLVTEEIQACGDQAADKIAQGRTPVGALVLCF